MKWPRTETHIRRNCGLAIPGDRFKKIINP